MEKPSRVQTGRTTVRLEALAGLTSRRRARRGERESSAWRGGLSLWHVAPMLAAREKASQMESVPGSCREERAWAPGYFWFWMNEAGGELGRGLTLSQILLSSEVCLIDYRV